MEQKTQYNSEDELIEWLKYDLEEQKKAIAKENGITKEEVENKDLVLNIGHKINLNYNIKNKIRTEINFDFKIVNIIEKLGCDRDVNIIADIFAGTGAVSSAFIDKQIITNDNMYSNYISHYAWFSPEDYSKEKIIDYISIYNKLKIKKENYMSKNFADTFFSKKKLH